MVKNKNIIEIQYINKCPNSYEMIKRVRDAVQQLDIEIDFINVRVRTTEQAQRIKFRGSPTVLINGTDLENLPESDSGYLTCRYYKNGLPSIESIKIAIDKAVNY